MERGDVVAIVLPLRPTIVFRDTVENLESCEIVKVFPETVAEQ
jgi:hypothetical protein